MSPEPITAILGSIGGALSGGALSGGAAAVAGGVAVASTAASIGSSIYSAVKPTPSMKIEAPPTVAKAAEAQGVQQTRIRRGLNYRNTIMAGALDQAGPMGKTKLGA